MRIKIITLLGVAALGLSACGDTYGEQGLVGAAAGVGTAVVLDGDPILGGVIGAAGNVAFCQKFPEKCGSL